MSGQAEHAFVKAFVNIIASQPVTFDDDFQELPEKTLKKVPIVQVRVAIDINNSSDNPFLTVPSSKCPRPQS